MCELNAVVETVNNYRLFIYSRNRAHSTRSLKVKIRLSEKAETVSNTDT